MFPDRYLFKTPSRGPEILVMLCAISVAGCASVNEHKSVHTLGSKPKHESVRLQYRSESDRLSMWAAKQGALNATTVAYSGSLPAVTTSELEIAHPHPEGRPGFALATVTFRPDAAEEQGDSLWATLTGSASHDGNAARPDASLEETWRLDVPEQQLDRILAKLRQQNFFRRSKNLNSEAFLNVELDGVGFGKAFAALPELDALVLRVRQQGRNAADIDLAIRPIRRLPRIP